MKIHYEKGGTKEHSFVGRWFPLLDSLRRQQGLINIVYGLIDESKVLEISYTVSYTVIEIESLQTTLNAFAKSSLMRAWHGEAEETKARAVCTTTASASPRTQLSGSQLSHYVFHGPTAGYL